MRAAARGAPGESLRLGCGQGDEFAQAARTRIRVHTQHRRRPAEQRDVGEGIERVIRGFRDGRRDHVRADTGDHQRITVGRRTGRHFGTDRPAGAGTVLDHEALLQGFRQVLRQKAGEGVGTAAGRERYDQAYRLRRPVLGASAADRQASGQAERGQLPEALAPCCRLHQCGLQPVIAVHAGCRHQALRVSGTSVSSGLPANQAARLSTTSCPMAVRVATVPLPTCGCSTTLSCAR